MTISHSFFLSSSLWKVLNTFFPRKYHFPRKQTVRYSLLFFALTFYFWGVRFSFLLRSVVCLTDDFLFVSFQETVDFFFLEKMDKKYHLSLYLTVLVFFASLGSQALAFTDPLDGNIVIGHFYMEYFLWKFAYFIGVIGKNVLLHLFESWENARKVKKLKCDCSGFDYSHFFIGKRMVWSRSGIV